MTFSKLSLLTAGCAMATAGGVHAAVIAEAGGGSTGTAQVIDASQDGAGAFSHTITGGVGGDAVLLGSGLITTEDAPGGHTGPVPAAQQTILAGTAGGSFVYTTHDGGGGGTVDMAMTQYTDATFTTATGSQIDNDRGRAAFEETPYGSPLTIGAGAGDNIFMEWHEVAGADHTPSITFGYDVLDITNATHRTDFFRLENLAAGDVTVAVLTDEATYGFFDSRLTFYDASGTLISTHDGDAGVGGHETVTLAGFGGGSLIVEVNNSKSTDGIVGTYELSITGNAVPEPGSLALLGLGGLAFLRRRG